MSLILRLLLKAAPLLLFILLSRAVRDMFRVQQGTERDSGRTHPGGNSRGSGARRDPYTVLGCSP